MAQIGIWGYTWGDPNPDQNDLYLEINGYSQNRIYFNAYDIFMDNAWGFGIFNFPTGDYLDDYAWNYFRFGDESTDYTVENFAIGIDTDTVNTNHSRWRWNDGNWHGTGSFDTDQGELMVSICLFRNRYDDTHYNKEFSISYVKYYDVGNDLEITAAQYLNNRLANSENWDQLQYLSNNNVLEGNLYQEYDEDTQTNSADSSDFIYHAGHGSREIVWLHNDDGTNSHNPDDDVQFSYRYQAYQGSSQYLLECDWSEDGLDRDAEWIWFDCCNCLMGFDGDENNNLLKVLLYHGAHMVFGNDDGINVQESRDIIEDFCNYAFEDEFSLINAWYNAYMDNDCYQGVCFYHFSNAFDYFWGIDSGPTFDSYSHSNIHCIRIPGS